MFGASLATYLYVRPFRYLTRRWTIQFPRSRTEDLVNNVGSEAETCMTDQFCTQCQRILNDSPLLVGRRLGIVRTREVYVYHSSLQELQNSANELCHLCTILWQSIPANSRSEAAGAEATLAAWLDALKARASAGESTTGLEAIQIRMSIRLELSWRAPQNAVNEFENKELAIQLHRDGHPLNPPLRIRGM